MLNNGSDMGRDWTFKTDPWLRRYKTVGIMWLKIKIFTENWKATIIFWEYKLCKINQCNNDFYVIL